MKFTCKDGSNSCILKLHSNFLTFELLFELEKLLDDFSESKAIVLNLDEVAFVCSDFLEFLKKISSSRKISLTCLHSEILVLLNLTEYDKFVSIFLTDFDFLQQKRELLNRKFAVV